VTTKAKHGGVRRGAGRPRKRLELGRVNTPVELLRALMTHNDVAPSIRLQAAKLLIEIERREQLEKNPFGYPFSNSARNAETTPPDLSAPKA